MKKIYSLLILLLSVVSVKSQTDYTIGSNSGSNAGTTYPSALQDFYEGSRSQYLYLASELTAAGMSAGLITSIKFDVKSMNAFGGVIPNYTLAIGTSNVTDLTTTSWEPGTTVVYGPVNYVPTMGINELTFTTAFNWNGTDNIIVEICNGDPLNNTFLDYTENVSTPWTTGLAFNASHTYRADNLGDLCGSATTTNSGTQTTRPDIIFTWVSAVACTGTPVGGTAVSSKDSVCANIPFYLFTNGSTLGTGLTYQWESSTDGVNYSDVSGATNFSLNVSAGVTATTYYRRKIMCSGGPAVTSTAIMVFVRPFFQCYCGPNTNVTLYTNTAASAPTIESVSITGGTPVVNYSNAHAGANPTPSLGYAAFTDTSSAVIPQLKQAGVYTLSITSSVAPAGAGIWVDWDHNGLFDSAEYQILSFGGTTNSDLQFEIPENAPLGVTVARIRLRNATLNYSNACTAFGNGETEDYVFMIVPGTACSGTILGGDAMASVDAICPNRPFSVSVTGATSGVTGISYQWQYSTDGGATYNDVSGATAKFLSVSAGINTGTYFRRQMTCSGGSAVNSDTAGVAMNAVIYCYCSPNNGTTLHTSTTPAIESINITGGTVNYSNSSTGAPANGYNLFDDTTSTFTLDQAGTYTLSVTTSAAPTKAAVWFDWDRSGTLDASEYTEIPIVTGTTTYTATINVPSGAIIGTTMMRVRVRAATFTTNSCEQYGSGETEDYAFKVGIGATCTGTPLGGAADASATSTCNGIPVNFSVTGASSGMLNLTFQWQDSIAGGSWIDISGATNETLTKTQLSARYYRRITKCNFSNISATSAPVFVDHLSVTYATIPFTEDFEATWDDGCGATGSHSIPSTSWRNYPLMTDSSWRRDDDGISAAWTNNFGGYTPTFSTGSYSARFHSYQATNGTSGNLDLYINCNNGSSAKRLSFDYINTSGVDSVRIMLSTDGGVTFTKLDTIKLADVWTNRTIDFNSNSATTVIRFRATSDFGVTDIGLDNLSVVSILAVDLATTATISPTGSIPATNSGNLTVTIMNSGGLPIDLSTNNATIGCRVTNPSNVVNVYSKVVNTGIIAAGASQNVTITTSANLTSIGNYSIKCGVGISGDGNNTNDSTVSSNFITTSAVIFAVANGLWGDGSTWSGGTPPTALDTVNITGYNVTLGGTAPSPYTCSSLGIGKNGNLTASGFVLNVGPSGGGNKALSLSAGATLTISGGTVNHNGMLLFGDSSNFVMSSGNLNVDGNDGTNAGSVGSAYDIIGFGTNAVPYSFGNINATGGTITIVDPHRFNQNAIAFRGSINTSLGAGNTLVMGDPASTHTTNTGANGFSINSIGASSRMSFGSLTINGGNTKGNRFTTATAPFGINGNLTVNSNSELRVTFQLHVAGNIVNNGVYASSSTTNFQSFTNGTAAINPNLQSVSGVGIFRNNVPTATVTAAGTAYAVGDIVTVSGGTNTTPATIYITAVSAGGNVLSASVLNMGNYTVAPTGAASVTGGTGSGATFTVNNLVSTAQFANWNINNSNAVGVSINSLGTLLPSQTGTISGTLTMTKGIITNGTNTITLGYSVANRGTLTYTSGVILGKFARWFTTATNLTTTGDFPVGKAAAYPRTVRVEFTSAPTKGGTLTAEYVATAPGLGGFPINDGINLVNIANDGFWRIDTDSIAGGVYTLSINDSGITNVQNLSSLRIVKRATNATNWGVNGTAGTNTGTATKPTVVRNAMSGFSEFAIAGANDNTLPFTSLKFTGERVGNANQLKWTVTNEIDVISYELQRSNDAVSYKAVGMIPSKATATVSASLNYSFTDNNSITGDGYYRLKQIAKDGSISYSSVVLIKGMKVTGIVVGNVYPNPAKEVLNVLIASSANKTVTINIFNVNGQLVMKINKTIANGDNNVKLSISNMAAGNYNMVVTDANGDKSNTISFIKQ